MGDNLYIMGLQLIGSQSEGVSYEVVDTDIVSLWLVLASEGKHLVYNTGYPLAAVIDNL